VLFCASMASSIDVVCVRALSAVQFLTYVHGSVFSVIGTLLKYSILCRSLSPRRAASPMSLGLPCFFAFSRVRRAQGPLFTGPDGGTLLKWSIPCRPLSPRRAAFFGAPACLLVCAGCRALAPSDYVTDAAGARSVQCGADACFQVGRPTVPAALAPPSAQVVDRVSTLGV
jgi:hypothetical protein